MLAQSALSAFDCDTTDATNGYNAFFAIESARPDLILLDISMPIMDGVETLTRLKAAPELRAIPVIMLTSRADHAVLPQLTALGAVGTLLKPFNEATLLEKIRGVLELKPRVTKKS